ncbi:MarR family winged helix-turn-helix transcriptional regulator [Glycomyces rhizosphaerae]|uniref:MarR family winged helix-turn-helix transcriptional regulator n=1 Tax=Glycomyces rhizosphaerae TaxID=2054422 RepID=A0ABV7Q035_9ACTN
MPTHDAGAEEAVERALVRIRRDQQARRLQQRAAEDGAPKATAANAARIRYLDALDGESDGRTISAVAEAIGVDRPRASRLTAELLAEGLVERRPDPGDSRYALIRLTAEGGELIAEIREHRRRNVAEALAGFTAAEARTFADLLERFVEAWPRGSSQDR